MLLQIIPYETKQSNKENPSDWKNVSLFTFFASERIYSVFLFCHSVVDFEVFGDTLLDSNAWLCWLGIAVFSCILGH